MNNKLITLVITLVVSIILVGTILVPVLNDAQSTIGEKVTYTNEKPTALPYNYGAVDTYELIATDVNESGWYTTYTLNGESFTVPGNGVFVPLLFTDKCDVTVWLGQSPIRVGYSHEDGTTAPTYLAINTATYPTLKLAVDNGVMSVVGIKEDTTETELLTLEVAWAYGIKDNGEYIAALNGITGKYYDPADVKSFVVSGGAYTTGDLDTFYTYYNGASTCDITAYSIETTLTGSLVAGTTDINKVDSFGIKISDDDSSETFVPYRVLIKETVIGHEAGGAAYSLLGVIPVMVIVALVVIAIGAIAINRND